MYQTLLGLQTSSLASFNRRQTQPQHYALDTLVRSSPFIYNYNSNICLGICISNFNETFSCASSYGKTPLEVSTTFATSEVLAKYALDLQHSISIVVPASGGVLFLCGLLALLTLKTTLKSQQSGKAQNAAKKARLWASITRALLSISTALSLTAAYSVTLTVSALHQSTVSDSPSSIQVGTGKTLQVLQWMTFSFSSLFAMSVHAMLRETGSARLGAGSTSDNYPPSPTFPPDQ